MAIVTVMFIVAAVELSPGSLNSGRNLEHALGAFRAAQAGVDYARFRLRQEVGWHGGEGGPTTTISTPELVVVEDNGNVVGILRTDVGEWAQFRIRFSNQNGTSDPSPEYWLEIPHVSVNNLSSTAPKDVPVPPEAPYAVIQGETPTPYKVPGYSVCLKVEGRAGLGLRDLGPTNVNGEPIPGRTLVTRVVEAFVKADYSDTLNAAAMAGGAMNVQLAATTEGDLELRTNDNKVPPKMRSKAATTIYGGTGTSENLKSNKGQVKTSTGTLNAEANYNAAEVAVGEEGTTDPFYDLEWGDVRKANPNTNTTDSVHLKAGTYVWHADGLHYYDMDLADYKTYMASTPPTAPGYNGVLLSQNLAEARLASGKQDGGNGPLIEAKHDEDKSATLTLREDVCVKPTDNASGFAMIPQGGAAEAPPNVLDAVVGTVQTITGTRVRNNLEPEDIKIDFRPGKRATLSTEGKVDSATGEPQGGDIFLGAKVEGQNGSITTPGDLKLVGGGDLAAPYVGLEEVGVNMYARGNITLNSYDEDNGSNSRYKDFKLAGVIYAWGDFTFEGAPPETGVKLGYAMGEWGKLDLTGSLVAYGRDPSQGLPSAATGKGNVNLRGRHVKLTYDSAYIGGLRNSFGVGSLRVSSWSEK